jgi:TolB-like protein
MKSVRRDHVERRLAAILAADVAGYSRLMGSDEEGTLETLKAVRAELIDPTIAEHRGRIVKTTGDGLLVEFASVVEALRCANEVQAKMAERNAGIPADDRIEFRIGIHQGDIVVEDGDIFGDGVNVAARLEGLAEAGGICISARVQEDAAGKLDLAFEDIGEQSLKNIARPLRVYRIRSETATPQPAAALPLPDKPSIAVLPFQNISGDPEQEYFAEGMVEEIVTALSRIRWLLVVARNSSKDHAGDGRSVGRELGVRYVLEGSVRKAGHRVRINAQLIDVATGAHLWADSFEGFLDDVFKLQDKVAISVAGVVEPALQASEIRRAAGLATSDSTAYDFYLRALSVFSSFSKEGIFSARDFLERAIARDPAYAPALSLAALCHLRAYLDDWAEDPAAERRKGIDRARRALEIARDDPVTIANAAFALTELGEDIGAMITLIDHALNLNPSYARGWLLSGAIRINAGQSDIAIEHLETSLRLSLRDRLGPHSIFIGYAHFFARRFDQAAPKLLAAMQEYPGLPWSYRALASCYAHMGRLEEAQHIIERMRSLALVVVPSHVPWRNPEHCELFLSGLRLAAGRGLRTVA